MEVKKLLLGLCPMPMPMPMPMATTWKQMLHVYTPGLSSNIPSFSIQTKESQKFVFAACAVLQGAEDVDISSSPSESFVITTTNTDDPKKIKLSVEVSGAKIREIYDDVFDKMVAAAQPIPGFRLSKGGKTLNIPKDVLLVKLGQTKVYKEVIKKVINTAVADYVQKEGLRVTKKLRVEQSFEDLEEEFSPDESFSFSAFISLQETN